MIVLPPTRIGLALFLLSMTTLSYAQHLSSARAISTGGLTAFAGGIASLDWNPAGLSGINDWELEATNFYSTNVGKGPSLFSAAIGKRFSDQFAASLRISPGSSLDLIIPSMFTLDDSSRTLRPPTGGSAEHDR